MQTLIEGTVVKSLKVERGEKGVLCLINHDQNDPATPKITMPMSEFHRRGGIVALNCGRHPLHCEGDRTLSDSGVIDLRWVFPQDYE